MTKRYGMVIDQERCIGCDACTVACRLEHDSPQGFIKVFTQTSDTKDVPSGDFPDLKLVWIPKLCNHCENAPCIDSCPEGALVKREDGIVISDKELCTGCKSCIDACPYNVIYFNEKTNIAEKCNLCAHRIDNSLEPFCAICCEGQAIYFGDLNDPHSKVSQIIAKKDTFQLKPELRTNPIIFYSPPKKKRKL
ncbi:MAG: 4Fe-4S dicluster domain-containing protein [Candidatus Lokiarchaeota archaeon]|nr:4Fe-4S dicluster domain-containing protein [Candidatus Lokiarchaeota archaeon]MBD3202582.1 4Fe-4S dicluster domain-containing protein [Candidatus Lokiarchaeota archaeon]